MSIDEEFPELKMRGVSSSQSSTPETTEPIPGIEINILKGPQASFGPQSAGKYEIGIFFLVAVIAQIAYNTTMLVIYVNSEEVQFFLQNVATLTFTGMGLLLYYLAKEDPTLTDYPDSFWGAAALFAVAPLGIQIVITFVFNIAFQGQAFAAVVPLHYYLFFLSTAIAEECLFRVGLQVFINTQLSEWNQLYAKLIAITLSVILFALLHTVVYSTTREITLMIAVGLIFAWAAETEIRGQRFLDLCIISHFTLNALAGITVINETFGGF